MFDVSKIRKEFPITEKCIQVYGSDIPQRLIYFDHGASTHPPLAVIDKYVEFIKYYYSNVHRGRHYLSMKSSELFDKVYETIFGFINAEAGNNAVILVSNTTQALDLAASCMKDIEGITLVSLMEHHSNDLPHRHRGIVKHFNLNADGTIDLNDLETKLKNNRVKLVAVTGASNVTGFMPDIHKIAEMSHRYGAKILVDAAQLLAHRKIDVKPNEDPSHIDFLAAAGHKAYSPFGSAFLFGPREILDNCKSYIPGGGTVLFVSENDFIYTESPDRHQGGTPNIAGAIALAEALHFLDNIGMDNIREHEIVLTDYLLEKISEIPGIKLLGDIKTEQRLGVITFNLGDLNNGLVADILNIEGAIAVRNGRFCAHPYMSFLLGRSDSDEIITRLRNGEKLDIGGAVRVSIGIYNTADEIDRLISMLKIISERKWKNDYSHKDYYQSEFMELNAS
jgi:selenocysteine lyase/cysteine desulfurase